MEIKFMRHLLVVMTAFLILFAGYFFYLTQIDGVWNPVLIINDEDTKTDKTEYKVGESMSVYLDYCKHRQLQGTISSQFVDGIIYTLPNRTSNISTGCNNTIGRIVEIPKNLPTGTYTLEQTISYEVNHFRTITYKVHSNQFKIINDGMDK